jgi:hypothetical protein
METSKNTSSNFSQKLKRASSIVEEELPNAQPNSIFIGSNSYITFINKERNKNTDDSIFDSSYIKEFLDLNSSENSFLIVDRLNKTKSIQEQISKNLITNTNEYLEMNIDYTSVINEDDFFFEENFRTKLMEDIKLNYYIPDLVHLNILQIPFPLEKRLVEDKEHYNIYKKEKIESLKGKFKIGKFLLKKMKIEDIISFINKRENNIVLKKSLIKDKIFVGINIKKIKREIYYISYLFAKEI